MTESLIKPKVGIVGFAEGHLHQAPYGDPEWEMWGINRLHANPELAQKKWTRWFNLHDLEKFHGKDPEHLEWLRNFPGPVYLRPQDIGKFDIPNQTPFPLDDLVKRFPPYFNNSISYLIAYAITLEPKEIGIWGVDMSQSTLMQQEYQHQRPSCELFIGIASGLGIPITLPEGTDLLKASHLYGFEDPGPIVQKFMNRLEELGRRKEQLKQELAQIDAQRPQLIAGINQLDGAMQNCQYFLGNLLPEMEGKPHNGQASEETVAALSENVSGTLETEREDESPAVHYLGSS